MPCCDLIATLAEQFRTAHLCKHRLARASLSAPSALGSNLLPTKKDTVRVSFLLAEKKGFEPYSYVAQGCNSALGALHYARFQRAATEQLCLPPWKASFPTRLRYVICAAAHSVCCGTKGENPFFSVKKKKDSHPKGQLSFLAEKKGFEPSRRLPDLHP